MRNRPLPEITIIVIIMIIILLRVNRFQQLGKVTVVISLGPLGQTFHQLFGTFLVQGGAVPPLNPHKKVR